MQYIQRYNLKRGKAGEARDWLLEHAQALADNAPEGWTYLGTWITCRGFGQFNCETRWELKDYAALGGDFGNETFQKLALEWWMDYTDPTRGGERYLMKSVADIAIMDGAD